MPKMRVLVVDDAVMMRRMISGVLDDDPEIEVVGVAASGSIALQKIPQVNPDAITMDVEMPGMNGIETVREIRKSYRNLPIIMFSTLTSRGAAATLDAILAGATDYVAKPANVGSITEGIERLRLELIPKIKAHMNNQPKRSVSARASGLPATARATGRKPSGGSIFHPPEILCVGSSTGGPNALADVFEGISSDFPLPIAIVQHMPPLFTQLLADRLSRIGNIPFFEGKEGMKLEPGKAYIAPGGKHMVVKKEGHDVYLSLNENPPENSCRPAVDVLFRSIVDVYGGNILGVILTGMGKDGLRGCELIREAGGEVVAQDEESSVVWGMPGYVVQAGLANRELPLLQIAQEINRRVSLCKQSLSHAD